ncbi:MULTISPECIES: MFS transporter [Arthrobacter]|uniref:MFS transporter n=1 Tax=Arthrobacter TaxID=1663 RepID=UPI00197ADF3E|nr:MULTISPECIES: MFS transporter [Arthrobacter]MBT8159221.1 MFS transporter [Arthrobacter sp. GN70]
MQTTHLTATRTNPVPGQTRAALGAAALGNFIITLDAVVVNVALPSIRNDVGGGMTGLQWVVDGYTLMFAGLLLTAGAVSDRLGARRSFAFGLVLFVIASLACGLAPNLGALVTARFIQGAAAAIMMPTTMALIGQTFRDPKQRARAIGVWAAAGAIAASSGPVVGGLLNLLSWRLIFLVNLPVGVIGLLLLARVRRSPQRDVPFDWAGQATAVLAMGGITYATIEAGALGLAARTSCWPSLSGS